MAGSRAERENDTGPGSVEGPLPMSLWVPFLFKPLHTSIFEIW